MQFNFRDLLVLKAVKSLSDDGLSPRRLRRQLAELRRRLKTDKNVSDGGLDEKVLTELADADADAQVNGQPSLAELSISAIGKNVVVADGTGAQRRVWSADSGQGFFDFGSADPIADITPIAARRELPAPDPIVGLTAEGWFERAVDLEEHDPAGAVLAYRRALRLNPECTESLINMGRLHAESGEAEPAREAFARAVELDPADPTAVYNLGVVSQDMGDDDEAIRLYRRVIQLDPELPEAHYNIATVLDRTGDARAAIRHINEYRKLTR